MPMVGLQRVGSPVPAVFERIFFNGFGCNNQALSIDDCMLTARTRKQ